MRARIKATVGVVAAILTLTTLAGPAEASTVRYIANNAEGLCISNGTVSLSPCNTWAGDAAKVHSTNYVRISQTYYYQYVNDRGQCLGVHGGSTSGGANLVFGGCASTSDHSQFWAKIDDDGHGFWMLQNAKSFLCAGVQGSDSYVGAPVIQGGCNVNSITQHWHAQVP
jgi:hypothetical protein